MRKYLSLLIALFAVGCVDESIDVLQVGGNVGIGADNLAIPLGYLPEKKLGDIITGELDNLVIDPVTGDYSFAYAAESQNITIDGSGNSFTLPAATFDVAVDYPSFKLTSAEFVVEDICYMGGSFNGMNILLGQQVHCPVDGLRIAGDAQGSSGYTFDVQVPKYVSSIDKVYAKHDPSLPGAPVDATFNLGSLVGINAGGRISLSLVIPEGCEAYDENFNLIKGGVYSFENREFGAGAQVVNFRLYIASISNTGTAENGMLSLVGDMDYTVSYEIDTKVGTITIDELPVFELKSNIVCEDAEVTLNSMELMEYTEFKSTMNIGALNGSVANVKSLKRIDFADARINLYVDNFGNWSTDAVKAGVLDDILVEVTMPEYFKADVDAGAVQLDSTKNSFTTTLSQLLNGVSICPKQIDFGNEGVSPGTDGDMSLDIIFGVRLSLKSGAVIRLKHLQLQDGINVKVGYDECTMVVSSVSGCVDFEYDKEVTINLDSFLGEGGLEINGLGVSPTIDFSIANPLTLPLYITASITPVRNDVAIEQQRLAIDKFEIHAATLADNGVEIIPATNKIRIGKNLEPVEGVTTIECDIDRLFSGAMPEALAINLSVATDPNKDVSLLIAPKYDINYNYGFNLPLAFDSALDLKYSGVMSGIGETIDNLELELSASGKLGLACDIESTIPLNLALDLEFLDANGRPTVLQLKPIGDAAVLGSADGKTPRKSTVGFSIELKNGNLLEQLKKVANLRYTLRATSSSSGVALNCNQTISATVSLEVDGNIGVDFEMSDL